VGQREIGGRRAGEGEGEEEETDQRSNQAQKFLLLWSVARRDEKGSDLNIGDLAT
jgi:hypothetical protein